MQPLAGDEPTAVGPYRLLGRLGSGGMGRVYLGRSAGGRTVAVKKSVTAEKLVASTAGTEGNHDGCDPGPNTVYLTPSDGELIYTSNSSAEGNAVAMMSRAGG